MNEGSRHIQRVYLLLTLLHTLSASLIWGINTLFLLDAGLSNAQVFAANAFFTAGLVLFEIPTGVVADLRGRRFSYLFGTFALMASTLLYFWMWHVRGPFWGWAASSLFLGFGFTFFSGAVQAWLVDALASTGFEGRLDAVFARGEIVEGIAMLTGSVAGGYLAQVTNLGAPYLLRALILIVSCLIAFRFMHDLGFKRRRGGHAAAEVAAVLKDSIDHGLRRRPVRWLMLAEVFVGGVSIYAFYAMQPYLLQLYGDPTAYGVAGLAAAIVGGAQIGGGLLVPCLTRRFERRTSIILAGALAGTAALAGISLLPAFWPAIALLVAWGLVYATVAPVRQAYLNRLVPSSARATVLSFDSLMGSAGGVVSQPLLGKAADAWGYPASYACCAAIQAVAIPFVWLARRERAPADAIGQLPDR